MDPIVSDRLVVYCGRKRKRHLMRQAKSRGLSVSQYVDQLIDVDMARVESPLVHAKGLLGELLCHLLGDDAEAAMGLGREFYERFPALKEA